MTEYFSFLLLMQFCSFISQGIKVLEYIILLLSNGIKLAVDLLEGVTPRQPVSLTRDYLASS